MAFDSISVCGNPATLPFIAAWFLPVSFPCRNPVGVWWLKSWTVIVAMHAVRHWENSHLCRRCILLSHEVWMYLFEMTDCSLSLLQQVTCFNAALGSYLLVVLNCFVAKMSSVIFMLPYIHTYTHSTALFPGLPGWAGTRKVKPIWILLKQETVGGSGISWTICKSAPSSRQITTPAPHRSSFFTGRMPFLPPNQQCQSTEGILFMLPVCV